MRRSWLLCVLALLGPSCGKISDEEILALYDDDSDGFYTPAASAQGEPGPYDCDDLNPDVYPDAPELCDGVDNDCDGEVDEGDATDALEWFADADTDGFGDPEAPLRSCEHPPGYVEDATDCDDSDPDVNPDSAWYADLDGDGFGDPDSEDGATGCENPDPETLVPNGDDCDDDAVGVFPDADEVVNNGADEDCDGFDSCYRDGDGDTYGSTVLLDSADLDCSDEGESGNGSDCDDGNGLVSPSAIEACNGFDDDCDGEVDEGVLVTSYTDADGDGFGDPSTSSSACDVPSGRVINDDDCDDADPDVSPDGEETVDDGIDQDCDSGDACWQDKDDDDHGTATVISSADLDCDDAYEATVSTDCDDANALVSPSGVETCNGVDDDCDGLIDEGVTATAYRDADGDGYGSSTGTASTGCSIPSGYSAISGDCDDGSALVSPVGTETCNGADDDCDGTVDDGVKSTFYADSDGDTYGGTTTTAACSAPTGYVADNTDCDDTDSGDYPGAGEIINNGDDEDCDGGDTCYVDYDNDDYGSIADFASVDLDCKDANEAENNDDCDDSSAADYPGAPETVNNGDDEDCDGVDSCYQDGDDDNYGTAVVIDSLDLDCADTNEATVSTDCDDASASDYPGATEVTANGDDDNCDGKEVCWADADMDGYRSDTATTLSITDLVCTKAEGEAWSTVSIDCNDADASVNPGVTMETCNYVDDDCDGVTDEFVTTTYYRDADGDGQGTSATKSSSCTAPTGYVENDDDCDDTRASVYDGATEVPANNRDDDCDSQEKCYNDTDKDGYGVATSFTPSTTDLDCTDPGESAVSTDCDDTRAAVNPGDVESGSTECYDGLDNDCDNTMDRFGGTIGTVTYPKDSGCP